MLNIKTISIIVVVLIILYNIQCSNFENFDEPPTKLPPTSSKSEIISGLETFAIIVVFIIFGLFMSVAFVPR